MEDIFICDFCGEEIKSTDESYPKCPICQNQIIFFSEEENVFSKDAYSRLREGAFFDAEILFSNLVVRFPKNHALHFGLALAKYGVIFEKNKKMPVVNSLSEESFFYNENYLQAVKLAPKEKKEYYKHLAEQIENCRQVLINVSRKAKPVEIFISAKNLSAKELSFVENTYSTLSKKGYSIFFRPISLKEIQDIDKEPYIYNAIISAKVMLVFGFSKEDYEQNWVKNDYNRFLKRLLANEKQRNSLLICHKDLDEAMLPKQLVRMSPLNMKSDNFIESIEAQISQIIRSSKLGFSSIGSKEIPFNKNPRKGSFIMPLLEKKAYGTNKFDISAFQDRVKLGFMHLENSNFTEAEMAFDEVIALNRFNCEAIWGKLLVLNFSKSNEDFLKSGSEKNVSETIGLFSEALFCAPKKRAQEFLRVFEAHVESLLERKEYFLAKAIFKELILFDYTVNKKLQEEFIKAALLQDDDELLKIALASISQKDFDSHVSVRESFAQNQLANKNFPLALKYINELVACDEGNTKALWYLIYALMECNEESFADNIEKFTHFSVFENILFFSNLRDKLKHISHLLEAALKKISDERGYNIFLGTLEYVPKAEMNFISTYLTKAGEILLAEKYFEKAERIYSLIITENKSDYYAHFNLLKAKLFCISDEELVFNSQEITSFSEMNKAMTYGADDKGFSEKMMNLINEQKSMKEFVGKYNENKRLAREDKIIFEEFLAENKKLVYEYNATLKSEYINIINKESLEVRSFNEIKNHLTGKEKLFSKAYVSEKTKNELEAIKPLKSYFGVDEYFFNGLKYLFHNNYYDYQLLTEELDKQSKKKKNAIKEIKFKEGFKRSNDSKNLKIIVKFFHICVISVLSLLAIFAAGVAKEEKILEIYLPKVNFFAEINLKDLYALALMLLLPFLFFLKKKNRFSLLPIILLSFGIAFDIFIFEFSKRLIAYFISLGSFLLLTILFLAKKKNGKEILKTLFRNQYYLSALMLAFYTISHFYIFGAEQYKMLAISAFAVIIAFLVYLLNKLKFFRISLSLASIILTGFFITVTLMASDPLFDIDKYAKDVTEEEIICNLLEFDFHDNYYSIKGITEPNKKYSKKYLNKKLSTFRIPEDYNGHPIKEVSEYAFKDQLLIKKVIFSANLKKIGKEAFSGCEIKEIYLPESILEIEEKAFNGNFEIIRVQALEKPEDWDLKWNFKEFLIEGNFVEKANHTIWGYVEKSNFKSKDILLYEKIPGKEEYEITGIMALGDYLLKEDLKRLLSNLEIPETYENLPVTRIKAEAFKERNEITSIKFSLNLKEIGDYAFYKCDNWKTVLIPKNVEIIGEMAFFTNKKRYNIIIKKKIYCEFRSKPESWHNNWFGKTFEIIWDSKK